MPKSMQRRSRHILIEHLAVLFFATSRLSPYPAPLKGADNTSEARDGEGNVYGKPNRVNFCYRNFSTRSFESEIGNILCSSNATASLTVFPLP